MKTQKVTRIVAMFAVLLCAATMVFLSDHLAGHVIGKQDLSGLDLLFFSGIYITMTILVVWIFKKYLKKTGKG